jgi:transposase-like protein
MFENLKVTLPDKVAPNTLDISSLTDEQKIELSLVWRTKGIGVTTIAKTFKVSRRTIYTWLAKAREHYIANLEESTYLELITDHDMQLEDLENKALAELDRVTSPEYGFDELMQVHKKKTGSTKQIADLLRTVLAIRQQRINLQMNCGLIPKVAEKLHHTIGNQVVADQEEYQMSTEDLRSSLLTKLTKLSRL